MSSHLCSVAFNLINHLLIINYEKALYYLEIASEKGIGMASLTISNLYYYGVGIQKGIDQAIDYCKLAIEQGTNEDITI